MVEVLEPIWVVYGAGRIGAALVRAAVADGRPVALASRDGSAARAIADGLGIEHMVMPLGDLGDVTRRFAARKIVGLFNTAGPFADTAPQLIDFCVNNGLNYADISNEHSSHAYAWMASGAARERGIAIVPGAGFGTVASEYLGSLSVARFATVNELTIILPESIDRTQTTGVSRSAQSILSELPRESRAGELVPLPPWRGVSAVQSPEGRRILAAVTNGDLEALKRVSPIDRVRVAVQIDRATWVARLALPLARARARRSFRRHTTKSRLKELAPSAETNRTVGSAHTKLRARLGLADGSFRFMEIVIPDRHRFTLTAGMHVMQRIQNDDRAGTYTAGQILEGMLQSGQENQVYFR